MFGDKNSQLLDTDSESAFKALRLHHPFFRNTLIFGKTSYFCRKRRRNLSEKLLQQEEQKILKTCRLDILNLLYSFSFSSEVKRLQK